MMKGERKRRRRAGEELTALREDVIATGASPSAPADSMAPATELPLAAAPAENSAGASAVGEMERAVARGPSPSSPRVRKLQMRPLGAPVQPSGSAVGADKPVALAQILSNPSFAARAKPTSVPDAVTEPAADEPAAEPAIPEEETPPTSDLRATALRPIEAPVEEVEPQLPAAYPPLHSYRPEPDEEPKRWTREPVLVALLLVGLIMLAFNTYVTMRMNGMSDRLSALGTQSAVVPTSGVERPWVGVDTISTKPFFSGGQPVTTVHIVNSGREPAYDLRSNTVGSLRSSATPAPDIPSQKGPLATTGLLLPNTGGNLTFFGNTRALTAEEAASVRSGQYILWLAGRLDYKDSKGRPHATMFRYRYDPNLNSFLAAPAGNVAN